MAREKNFRAKMCVLDIREATNFFQNKKNSDKKLRGKNIGGGVILTPPPRDPRVNSMFILKQEKGQYFKS